MNPSAIWLRQVFPVQIIKIFISQLFKNSPKNFTVIANPVRAGFAMMLYFNSFQMFH
jgi:hypothetical protein